MKKAGVIGVIGIFTPQAMVAPIATIQQRNLAVRRGNCNNREYIPKLVATGAMDPTHIPTQTDPVAGAIEAYDRREPSCIKVKPVSGVWSTVAKRTSGQALYIRRRLEGRDQVTVICTLKPLAVFSVT